MPHPFRGLSKLIPRGTGFRVIMQFGRGLVMHGWDVYQYGVMTGTPTPAQEMEEGSVQARRERPSICAARAKKKSI